MRTILRLSIVVAALAFSGCAAQAGTEGEDDFVASDAEALHASSLYKSLVGDYRSADTLYPRFTLDADRTFTLDTGIRCITTPCASGDSGRWTLYTYRGRYYLNLAGASLSRWYLVQSFAKGALVGITEKGTWTKIVAEPTSGCAAMLCAVGSVCVDDGAGAKCVYSCLKDAYVNCMPPVSEDRAHLCSGDYHEWIKSNCSTEFVY